MTNHTSSTTTLAREAMGTVFSITAAHVEPDYAREAMHAALDELDLLEERLSRFRPSSDIARINQLRPGEKTTVAPETLACLQAALTIERETDGAFDVGYASEPAAGARIELGTTNSTVRVLSEGVRLDLGGIGKGFALDRMAGVLADWDIPAALLWASTSTVLAKGRLPRDAAWSVSIGPEHARRRISLDDAALSASGTAVQGQHIVDPRCGRPVTDRVRRWARAASATQADALSTALMVMSDAEINRYCRQHADVSLFAFDTRGRDLPVSAENSTRISNHDHNETT